MGTVVTTFFRADKLALATLFQSKEAERYYLNGVHIESTGNDGAVAVATDGHLMAVFRDEAGFTSSPCIVPMPKAAIDCVRKRKTREFCWFGIIGDHGGAGRHVACIFDTTDQASELDEVRERMLDPKDRGIIWSGAFDLIDGEFPTWRAVVPKAISKTGAAAAYNGKFIANFAAVAKDRSDASPVMIHSDGNGPALVTVGRDDFVGVIMPVLMDAPPLIDDMRNVRAPSWIHGQSS